jgi:hypothetical protein
MRLNALDVCGQGEVIIRTSGQKAPMPPTQSLPRYLFEVRDLKCLPR